MAKSWRLSSASLQRNGRGACVHRHGHAAWYPAGVERMRTCIWGGRCCYPGFSACPRLNVTQKSDFKETARFPFCEVQGQAKPVFSARSLGVVIPSGAARN